MTTQFERKTIRLGRANYVGLRTYFVTICCEKRCRAFLSIALAARAVEMLRESAERFSFVIHAYCVMPDHVHILTEGMSAESCLPDFVDDFKHRTAFEFQPVRRRQFWQSKYYDHVLRKRDSQDAIAWYIWMNPVRQGIVNDPWEYPLSGSFTLDWRNRLRPPVVWDPPWRKRNDELK